MSSTAVAFVAGPATVMLGVMVAALPGRLRFGLAVQAVGVMVIGVAAGFVAAAGHVVGRGFSNGLAPVFGIDPLSAVFLMAIALIAVPALVYARDALQGAAHAGAIGSLTGVFVLALVGVVMARDAVTFLLMWELMSIAPAVTILLTSHSRDVCRTVLIYLGLTHIASVGVWISMLVLVNLHAFGSPGVIAAQSVTMQSLLAVAALIGFGTKAGLMPLHTWLPRAHPVAPSHVSALMSGMMIKVALYGLVRMLFEWLAPVPGWVGPALLALAALSSVGGVLYALMQHELKRLLAFHSVENVGIIVLGLGAALIASSDGHRQLAAIAFAAALLHTVNHALFKSLLFLCAGSFQKRVGKLDLDRMGGLLRTMPVTGTAFLIGAMAIAGVPPFNGFVSEWLTLQALVQLALNSTGAHAMWGALAAAALGATAALAVFCFVKVVGLVLLGAHRQKQAVQAREVPLGMTAPVVFLASMCVLIGIVPGTALGMLDAASPFGHLPASLLSPVKLSLPGSGSFAGLGAAVLVLVVTVILQLARRRSPSAAPSPMWLCGQSPSTRLAWTSAGFTKSLRLVLEIVLRPQRTLTVESDGAVVRSIHHESHVPHLLGEWLYRPLLRIAMSAGRTIRRMQSGSLRTYLAYLLVTLALALAGVRWGVA